MSVESPQWRPNPELENVGSEVEGHASCYPDQTQPDYDAFEWIGNYFVCLIGSRSRFYGGVVVAQTLTSL